MNSRAKGKTGELELVHFLNSYGYETRRGLQYQSGQVEADIEGLKFIHCEVKRVERLNIENAMEQSKRDAIADAKRQKDIVLPAVFHRKNRGEWLVTMELDKWQALYDAFLEKRTGKGASR